MAEEAAVKHDFEPKNFIVNNTTGVSRFEFYGFGGFIVVGLMVLGYVGYTFLPKVGPVIPPVPPAAIIGPNLALVNQTCVLAIRDKIELATWTGGDRLALSFSDNYAYFTPTETGHFVVSLAGQRDGKVLVYQHAIEIVGAQPPPPIPIPPPVPPIPPTPPVPPGPVKQLRVLFVYETSANQTREQLNIINSTKIRGYLNEKAKGEYRYWDKDIDVSKETAAWQEIWAATKPQLGTLPSIVIIDGTRGQVFPLPATEEDTLSLIRKAAG